MKILFFDFETTGLSKDYNEILEIAAITYDTDTHTIIDTFNEFIKPQAGYVPYKITELTGITTDQVKYAQYEGVVLNQFMQFVNRVNPEACCGHNILRFDLPWLKHKAAIYTIHTHPCFDLPFDTLPMAKDVYAAGLMPNYNGKTAKGNLSFTQANLMNYFEMGTQEHRAITDVEYDIQLYLRFQKLLDNADVGF